MELGVENMNLLLNSGSVIIPLIPILLIQYILIKMGNKCAKANKKSRFCRKLGIFSTKNSFSFVETILRIYIETYIEFTLISFMGTYDLFLNNSTNRMKAMLTDGFGNIFNSILVIISLVVVLFLPAYIFNLAKS